MPTEEEIQEAEAEDEADRVMAAALGADAVLHIRNADKMTEEGRLVIADWLRQQADTLLTDGHNYATMFTARYNPED